MTYKEASQSGKPFNRKIYKDGWYLHDDETKIDWHVKELTQRLWTKRDLQATDWVIEDEK